MATTARGGGGADCNPLLRRATNNTVGIGRRELKPVWRTKVFIQRLRRVLATPRGRRKERAMNSYESSYLLAAANVLLLVGYSVRDVLWLRLLGAAAALIAIPY